jgi:hypothetical protein
MKYPLVWVIPILVAVCDLTVSPATAKDLITISPLAAKDIDDKEVTIVVTNTSSGQVHVLCVPEAKLPKADEWQEFELAIWPSHRKVTPLMPVDSAERTAFKWTPRPELRGSHGQYRIRCDVRQLVDGKQQTVQAAYTEPFRL